MGKLFRFILWLHVLFSGPELEVIPNVTIMATRISSPTGKNTPNNMSPSLSAKIHMYATDIIATANQQLTTIAVLDSIITPMSRNSLSL